MNPAATTEFALEPPHLVVLRLLNKKNGAASKDRPVGRVARGLAPPPRGCNSTGYSIEKSSSSTGTVPVVWNATSSIANPP